MDAPKVLIFGGGTGLSGLLNGLKKYPIDITAVCNVSDDGGSSGKLRTDFKVPALGDIRRVLVSLSDSKNFDDLFEFRFEEGEFKGHTVGNIILLALTRITGSFKKAVSELSNILNIKGRVLPVCLDEVTLKAEFFDGTFVYGETNIVNENKPIKRLSANDVEVNKEVLKAIKDADMIIYSQGSLYTSLLSNLIFDEVKNELEQSSAIKVYICNIMTQKGETDGFSLYDHVKTLSDYIGVNLIDVVIGNSNLNVENDILDNYKKECSVLVEPNELKVINMNIDVVLDKLIYIDDDKIRHDIGKLSKIIMKLLLDLE